ncbi:hypothetical protein EJB05_50077, partial [Eragrostis curvula]
MDDNGDSDVYGEHAGDTDDDDYGGSGEDGYFDYGSEDNAMCEDEDENDVVKKDYTVLTEADVRARQEEATAKVVEVLSIPAGFAAVLLRYFKWRTDQIQETWFADEARIRDAVGLPADGDGGAPVATALNDRELACGICFGKFAAGGVRSAGCRAHFYCHACWRWYLRAAVGDGARCLALRCPEPSCGAAVVRELVDAATADDDAGVREQYARLALRSYVEESGGGRRIRWCPGPGCTRAVELGADAKKAVVTCDCLHAFCFQCGEEPHRPVSCATVRAWLEKNATDGENARWVLTHAKHCPRCRRPIEKNQGCMHMTCPPPCDHEFCWVCLDPWNSHHGCAGFRDPDTAAAAEDAAERRRRQARASLDRYMYYYERWAANQLALHMAMADAEQLGRSGLVAMAVAVGKPDMKLDFMTKGYDRIIAGRRVLQWTYAYGYFLDPARHGKVYWELFEDLQDQANSWLDRLHEAVELERKEIFCADGGDPDVVCELLGYYKEKVEDLTYGATTCMGNLVKAFENDLPELTH